MAIKYANRRAGSNFGEDPISILATSSGCRRIDRGGANYEGPIQRAAWLECSRLPKSPKPFPDNSRNLQRYSLMRVPEEMLPVVYQSHVVAAVRRSSEVDPCRLYESALRELMENPEVADGISELRSKVQRAISGKLKGEEIEHVIEGSVNSDNHSDRTTTILAGP